MNKNFNGFNFKSETYNEFCHVVTVLFCKRELVLLSNCWNKQLMTVDSKTDGIYSKKENRPAYGEGEKAQSGIDSALVFSFIKSLKNDLRDI